MMFWVLVSFLLLFFATSYDLKNSKKVASSRINDIKRFEVCFLFYKSLSEHRYYRSCSR